MIDLREIYQADPDVADAIRKVKQQNHLELIASENFVSLPVLAAMGTHLTNNIEYIPAAAITADANTSIL